jgi:hypothetical protein
VCQQVLDPRLYRAAFAPILLALVVAAFSLMERPKPLTTTLAPDAFDGPRAFAKLQGLAAQFPDRRPGGPGDTGLARRVEHEFQREFCPGAEPGAPCEAVSVRTFSAQTVDGEADLETVVATRLGQPGPGLMVVAHRDAAGRPAEAALSGTAALLELARVFGGRRTQRTLTLVSTSGGSGGAAGAAELAANMPDDDPRPDAVIVLGDMASAGGSHPWVLPWSDDPQLAPIQLRRTAEAALKLETGDEPGQPRAITQLARLAFPFAQNEQAPFNAAGIPSVAFQASAERGPDPGDAVSADRLRGFGRGALRTIAALDAAPSLDAGPSAEVVMLNKVLPPWVARLLVGVLLLPMLVAAIDGLARVRRRKAAVAVWLRWLAALTFPFAATALVARLLGATGVIDAPGAAVPAGLVPVDALPVAIVALVFVLGVVAVRPLQHLLAARPESAPAVERESGGAASALTLVITFLAVAVWIVNPFAAGVLVLPAHLWMLAAVPEVRLRRLPALALVLAALLPAALVLAVFAHAIGASPTELPWALLLLVAGGQVGLLSLLVLSIAAGCAVGAFRLALLPAPGEAPPDPAASVRGPMGYAGPGSLGGTESGFGSGVRR